MKTIEVSKSRLKDIISNLLWVLFSENINVSLNNLIENGDITLDELKYIDESLYHYYLSNI